MIPASISMPRLLVLATVTPTCSLGWSDTLTVGTLLYTLISVIHRRNVGVPHFVTCFRENGSDNWLYYDDIPRGEVLVSPTGYKAPKNYYPRLFYYAILDSDLKTDALQPGHHGFNTGFPERYDFQQFHDEVL